MATLVIRNTSSASIYFSDFYATVAAGASLTVTRSASDLPKLTSLQHQLTAGNVTLSVTYSADELGSDLMAPPQSVGANDIEPVAATATLGGCVLIRKSFTAGGGGSADDVTVYAVNTLPFKLRVVSAWALVATAVSASTLTVRTAAAGAGTALATMSSGSTGYAALTNTASVVATPGSSVGLFIRRSDSGAAGEVFLLCRPES